MVHLQMARVCEKMMERPSRDRNHRFDGRVERVARIATLGLLGLLVVGCSDSNPFTQVKVAGKVTYEDGTPIPAERIRVWFKSQTPPLDGETHPRPASALVNVEDGTFEGVTTHKYLDGIIKGEHLVFLDLDPADAVPEQYRSERTTPLRVSTDDAPFHIKVPAP